MFTQKLVYEADVTDLIGPGCASRNHCFLTMTPLNLSSGEALGPINTFYLSSLSGVVGLKDPKLKVRILKKLINRIINK